MMSSIGRWRECPRKRSCLSFTVDVRTLIFTWLYTASLGRCCSCLMPSIRRRQVVQKELSRRLSLGVMTQVSLPLSNTLRTEQLKNFILIHGSALEAQMFLSLQNAAQAFPFRCFTSFLVDPTYEPRYWKSSTLSSGFPSSSILVLSGTLKVRNLVLLALIIRPVSFAVLQR